MERPRVQQWSNNSMTLGQIFSSSAGCRQTSVKKTRYGYSRATTASSSAAPGSF